MLKKLIVAIAVGVSALALASAPASAAPSWDPNATRTANPAQACASIPGTLAALEQMFGVDLDYDDFSYTECVRTLAGRVPDVPPPFGSPYEQCAMLEEGVTTPGGTFQISYPYVFHAEPGDPFPNLRANNREQCARALWTFHTIESYLPPPPPGG